MMRASWKILVLALTAAAFLLASASSAVAGVAPVNNTHTIPFFIHSDVLDPGSGRDLAFYQQVIDDTLEDAQAILYGGQGPFDSPCCTEIVLQGVLTEFDGTDAGRSFSELNVVNFGADQADLQSIVGSGSGIFFIDSLSNCAGSGAAIGCASTPSCDGDPNDDPNLITVVTLEAFEGKALAQTVAHERGHNTCLLHETTTDQCQLMRPAAGGGCLTQTECGNYINGRNGTNGTCACQSGGQIVADDTVCSEGALSGTCSGGVCTPADSDKLTTLMASADPDFPVYVDTLGTEVFDARLRISGAPGDWTNEGAWDGGDEPQGLAYAPERGLVYGVRTTAGSDELLEIDPSTGATLARRSISGRSDIIALAWDPGPTASPNDDMLLGLDSDGSFEDLIEIDPDDASSNFVGSLDFGTTGRVTGMAYDPVNDDLLVASFAGLFEIDRSTCNNPPAAFCQKVELRDEQTVSTTQPQGITLASIGASLAYSNQTGNFYLIGNQVGVTLPGPQPPAGTFRTSDYVVLVGGTIRPGQMGIDYVDTYEGLGLDGLTTGGLAALPAPEPSSALLAAAAAGTLALLRRRRRQVAIRGQTWQAEA